MSAEKFLSVIREKGVELRVEGGDLRCVAPKGVLTQALVDGIRTSKAELIDLLMKEARASESIQEIPRIARDGFIPLSFAQERMWFLDQLQPNTAFYNIPLQREVAGTFEHRLLCEGLDRLVLRHEALRTRFREVDGQPRQVIEESARIAAPLIDLSDLTEEAAATEAERICAEEARRPFDLETDFPIRASVIRLCADKHILFVNIHHIIGDGVSIELLFRDLDTLCGSLWSGTEAGLRPLEIQYADYAAWQRQRLQGKVLADHLSYWHGALQGAPAVLDFPFDKQRPAVQTYKGACESFAFPPALLAAIKSLSQREEASVFMTLLAAFQVLLFRYSGQSDFVVGSPVSGRIRTELEEIVGLFVNTLPIRCDLSGNPTFIEALAETRDTVFGALAHQDLPLEKLVEEIRPVRDLSYSPIFQFFFTFQDAYFKASASGAPVPMATDTSKFDLSVYMKEADGLLKCDIEYCTDLLNRDTVVRLAGHFEQLLHGIAENPHQRIESIPMLTVEDASLLAEWNRTQESFLSEACMDELFEKQVLETPDNVAVIFNDQTLTYRQLSTRVDQLAQCLRSVGVSSGVLVGLCVERSLDMVVGLLGILKAGGAYVPLDPNYPTDRIAFMLKDANPLVLLTQQAIQERLPQHHARTICVDAPLLYQETHFQTAPARSAADLAYVIYTSGSTGTPKGVQISHRALVNFLTAMQRVPGIEASDTVLALTTLSFDIAGLELFLPLVSGARVVIAGGPAIEGTNLLALLAQHDVTLMQATPATWRMLLELGWKGSARLKALCGGEAWSIDLAKELLPRCESLWNMYGPTETTVWSAVAKVTADEAILIGSPIANTTLHVLSRSQQPVPIGVSGELYIGGDGVARGYLNRPELTSERFIPDTFQSEPGNRLYRTGDLVRRRPDGRLEYQGRNDNQIKIRGFRIELGEIESILGAQPGVKECVVVVREDVPGDQRLVGYIVPVGDVPFEPDAARMMLREKLPEYMVPGVFSVLAALPLTPNGKVDRKALPPPVTLAHSRDKGSEVFMTPAQRSIADIWCDVLHVQDVGLNDNFFDLGGHSFLIIKLHARLTREFSTEISIVELFQRTTIAAQADRMTSGRRSSDVLNRARLRAEKQRRG